MENLFNFATKELSQDAFLAWLIKSAKQDDKNNFDKESYEVAREFLWTLADFGTKIKIKKLEVEQQLEDIDVAVFITTDRENDDKKVGLFIEDKVDSDEHDNQLKKYSKYIDDHKEEWGLTRVVKRFYKTTYVSEEERKRIKDAGWEEFSNSKFDCVKDFFKKYKDSKNLIIKQYARHIIEMCEDSKNETLPAKKRNNNRRYAWKSFFERKVVPVLKDDYNCDTSRGTYKYASLIIRSKHTNSEYFPYLEIRSNECGNCHIHAKVKYQGYWMAKSYYAILSYINKDVFSVNKGAETDPDKCPYMGEKGFIIQVKRLAKEYQKAVNAFRNKGKSKNK